MKVIVLMIGLMVGVQSWAGGRTCVAVDSNSNKEINFILDWSFDGTVINFEEPVTLVTEDLIFDVIYSTHIGGDQVIIANSRPGEGRMQMLELRINKVAGTLKAGELLPTMRQLGKYALYNVRCDGYL